VNEVGAVAIELLDNWIILGLFAAGAWAMSSLLDVCFVGEKIYRDPLDGPAIVGLFCLFPALAAARSLGTADIAWEGASLAMLSALCYLLHLYFYFRALFELNDASNAEIFNTLSVLLVPILAFVFLGERMAWANYVAIVVAGVGVVLLVIFQSARLSRSGIVFLIFSVTFVSLSMVMQAQALQFADYGVTAGVFSVTAFLLAALGLAVARARRRHVLRICRKFSLAFVLVQALELAAVFGSQRAIDIGPSVSLVALLESALPIFIMIFSWFFIAASRRWQIVDMTIVRSALSPQIAAAPSKLTALAMIVAAIALAQP